MKDNTGNLDGFEAAIMNREAAYYHWQQSQSPENPQGDGALWFRYLAEARNAVVKRDDALRERIAADELLRQGPHAGVRCDFRTVNTDPADTIEIGPNLTLDLNLDIYVEFGGSE